MNRLEVLREYIDKELVKIRDHQTRRVAYVHLYGVSQFAGLLALRRNLNPELAEMAGMLHDLHSYKTGNPLDHAKHGAVLAK